MDVVHTLRKRNWAGPLSAGIDGAVDNFAPVQGGSLEQTETQAVVQIDGLNSLSDFAEAQRMLESMPGTRRASVVEASGSTASFDVTVRGGVDAIDRALTGSGRFARSGASGGRPVFQYRPQ